MSRTKNSGQILLIAAFLMAMLILSTQLYIFQVAQITDESEFNSLNDFILAIKLGSQHAVISCLANVSNGGAASVFAQFLERWSSTIGRQYHFGKSILNYEMRESAPYSSGFWIYWGSNGYGVSSAYVNFTYTLTDQCASIDMPYSINITTTLFVESRFKTVLESKKQVNLTINLLNEGKPAWIQQLAVYCRVFDGWQVMNASNNYVVFDYGNGTYRASFTAETPTPNVEVSVRAIDRRGILAQANVTSAQI